MPVSQIYITELLNFITIEYPTESNIKLCADIAIRVLRFGSWADTPVTPKELDTLIYYNEKYMN